MRTKLISALRVAAIALENSTFHYNWRDLSSCNCGVLFCALTGMSAAELEKKIPKPIGDDAESGADWTMLTGQYCPIVGTPTESLFRDLYTHGLDLQDIVHLEYLSDPEVLRKMKNERVVTTKRRWFEFWKPLHSTKLVRDELDHEDKAHTIAYMRAWADLLEEEDSKNSPTK